MDASVTKTNFLLYLLLLTFAKIYIPLFFLLAFFVAVPKVLVDGYKKQQISAQIWPFLHVHDGDV